MGQMAALSPGPDLLPTNPDLWKPDVFRMSLQINRLQRLSPHAPRNLTFPHRP